MAEVNKLGYSLVMKEFLSRFGNRIKALRLAHGLSQDKFAEMLDLSNNTISTIENGKSFVKMTTLLKICKTFNVTADDLISKNGEENELISAIILGAKTLTPQQQKQLIEIIKTFKA